MCFVFLFVFRVYVCLICENPGIDVVLTRAVSLLWSVGDRHRRVAVRRSLSIQGHTCKAPLGYMYVYTCTYIYSIQVSHGPKDRAEPHNGLLLSARLSTLDASPGVLRHFCKVPRGEHGNDTVAHARSYCVVVQVDNFCEILPHSSGHLQPACSA